MAKIGRQIRSLATSLRRSHEIAVLAHDSHKHAHRAALARAVVATSYATWHHEQGGPDALAYLREAKLAAHEAAEMFCVECALIGRDSGAFARECKRTFATHKPECPCVGCVARRRADMATYEPRPVVVPS
jgi:hypothetical protein